MRVRSAAAVCAAVLAVACRSPTGIAIEVTTDLPCADAGTPRLQTSIAVGTLGDLDTRPPSATTTTCDALTGRIGTLVIVPSGADDEEVAVRVVTALDQRPEDCAPASGSRACIVSRRLLRFRPHEVIELPIEMCRACEGVVCPPDQTCEEGACVPASVLTYDAGEPDADAPVAGPDGGAPGLGAPDAATGGGRDAGKGKHHGD